MAITADYAERVYAGVLGKIIGVYLGRPFEGWSHRRIVERLGEIDGYVNDRIAPHYETLHGHRKTPPLVVTDDDITGTFTFLRALDDSFSSTGPSAQQIGEAWLNYIIENRTILWWGGFGNSTEHTAYLRLKRGTPAPDSGSARLNGSVIAEQIGAQIFIDGWAMVCPGDPERAADLAYRAGSVSHDGEALYGAQALAAMEAAAFVEGDITTLLDTAVRVIPRDSTIARVISDVREWREVDNDWYATFRRIERRYGYDRYPGNVHMVPNHALIILGLVYSNDDFHTALKVVNTAGWDTDCNSGNLGCLMGIKNGLAGLDGGPDWRGPVADRILMPTADGGRAITDAVRESTAIVNLGRRLAGLEPDAPKGGARFSFAFPGSVQGFSPVDGATIENVEIGGTVASDDRAEGSVHGDGPGRASGGNAADARRALAIRFRGDGGARTPTFKQPHELGMEGYELLAGPTLHAGQTVRAALCADREVTARLAVQYYGDDGELVLILGPEMPVPAGGSDRSVREFTELEWRIPDTAAHPIATVGVALSCAGAGEATALLDYLTWDGEPETSLSIPPGTASSDPLLPHLWRHAWVEGLDQWDRHWGEPFRLSQNAGRGLLSQGSREWRNYEVDATISVSLAARAGIAVRVQGMRRYYALLLTDHRTIQIVKVLGAETVMAEASLPWRNEVPYRLTLRAHGTTIVGSVDGKELLRVVDVDDALDGGAAAFVLEEGHMAGYSVDVRPTT